MNQEILKVIQKTIEEISLYKRTPFVRSGLIICDEEHFKGWKLSQPLLNSPTGLFLNIYKNEKLRGQSGFLFTKDPTLTEALIRIAKSAAFQDPNFDPMAPEELNDLTFELFILDSKNKMELYLNQFETKTTQDKIQKINMPLTLIIEQDYKRQISLPQNENQPNSQNLKNIKTRLEKLQNESDFLKSAPETQLFIIPTEIINSNFFKNCN